MHGGRTVRRRKSRTKFRAGPATGSRLRWAAVPQPEPRRPPAELAAAAGLLRRVEASELPVFRAAGSGPGRLAEASGTEAAPAPSQLPAVRGCPLRAREPAVRAPPCAAPIRAFRAAAFPPLRQRRASDSDAVRRRWRTSARSRRLPRPPDRPAEASADSAAQHERALTRAEVPERSTRVSWHSASGAAARRPRASPPAALRLRSVPAAIPIAVSWTSVARRIRGPPARPERLSAPTPAPVLRARRDPRSGPETAAYLRRAAAPARRRAAGAEQEARRRKPSWRRRARSRGMQPRYQKAALHFQRDRAAPRDGILARRAQ